MSQNDLYKAIDKILRNDWDPIGIKDSGGLDDEYRGYVPEILRLKVSGGDLETIALKLNEIATQHIGLDGNMISHCRQIAEKIIEL